LDTVAAFIEPVLEPRRRARIPLAACGLCPLFRILLSPVMAAAVIALSSLSAIGNALRRRAVEMD